MQFYARFNHEHFMYSTLHLESLGGLIFLFPFVGHKTGTVGRVCFRFVGCGYSGDGESTALYRYMYEVTRGKDYLPTQSVEKSTRRAVAR